MSVATPPVRLAILASGGGSNLQAILDHLDAQGDARAARVVLVASNKSDAGALARARERNIPVAVIAAPGDGPALVRLLESHDVECIALAGYLKLVPNEVTRRWRGRIVNIHPALLPKFGGAGMYGRRVHDAVIAAGDAESGATVHHVDDQYDRGAIIDQERVPVVPGDTAESLAARVLAAEHRLYPRVIDALARQLSTSR
jgi:formyltetrahydrofolate-dependent phosphoribosylglycinamide formyltransferase